MGTVEGFMPSQRGAGLVHNDGGEHIRSLLAGVGIALADAFTEFRRDVAGAGDSTLQDAGDGGGDGDAVGFHALLAPAYRAI